MTRRYDAIVIGAGVAGAHGRDPARAGGMVRRARREGDVSAPQGLRRVHRRPQPARCSTRSAWATRIRASSRARRCARVGLFAGERPRSRRSAALRRRADAAGAARSAASTSTRCSLRARGALGARIWQPWTVAHVERRESLTPAALRQRIRRDRDARGAGADRGARLVGTAAPWREHAAKRARAGRICSRSRRTSAAPSLAPGLLPVLAFRGRLRRNGDRRRRTCSRSRAASAATRCGDAARAPGARAGDAVLAHLEATAAACARRSPARAREGRVARRRTDPARHPRAVRASQHVRGRQRRGRGASDRRRRHQHGDPVGVAAVRRLTPRRARRLLGGASQRASRAHMRRDWRRSFAPRVRCRRRVRASRDAAGPPRSVLLPLLRAAPEHCSHRGAARRQGPARVDPAATAALRSHTMVAATVPRLEHEQL